jgi:hypothetical protein
MNQNFAALILGGTGQVGGVWPENSNQGRASVVSNRGETITDGESPQSL